VIEELSKPGYLHVVLTHLPILGMAFGLFALAVALLLRHRAARVTALSIIALAGASAWPVLLTGQQAYRPVRALTDDAGSDALDEHRERAETWAYVFYATALLALAAIWFPARWPWLRTALEALATLGAAASFCISLYISQAGGQVRHTEFRPGPAPTPYLRPTGLVPNFNLTS
jgi:hypothetical protein